MKISSVFSASCRYMAACCRKYSSQSMLRQAPLEISVCFLDHFFQGFLLKKRLPPTKRMAEPGPMAGLRSRGRYFVSGLAMSPSYA